MQNADGESTALYAPRYLISFLSVINTSATTDTGRVFCLSTRTFLQAGFQHLSRAPCVSLMVINEPGWVFWALSETGFTQKSVLVKYVLMKEMWLHWDSQLPQACSRVLWVEECGVGCVLLRIHVFISAIAELWTF